MSDDAADTVIVPLSETLGAGVVVGVLDGLLLQAAAATATTTSAAAVMMPRRTRCGDLVIAGHLSGRAFYLCSGD
jgi:hypothetical protein